MYSPIKEKKTVSQSIKKEINIFFKKIYWKNITNLIYFYRSYIFKREKIQPKNKKLEKKMKAKK